MILATRGSELARAHGSDVQDALAARFPAEIDVQRIVREDGNESVLRGEADVAVHRMEHLPPKIHEDLVIAGLLPRGPFTDALVSDASMKDLPKEGRVATTNIRRRAMLLRARADLKIVEAHADVKERIGSWRVGDVDAVVLPTASVKRLAIEAPFEELDPATFVPGAGQGALGCVCKRGSRFEEFLEGIDDGRTRSEVEVERAILHALGANLGMPVGLHAAKRGTQLTVHAIVLSLDGRRAVSMKEVIAAPDALYHADELGERLKGMGADVLLDKARRLLE